MGHVTVVIKERPEGWGQYVRSVGLREHLNTKAHEFVEIAKGVYQGSSHHEDKPPVFYLQSFYIKRIPWPVEGAFHQIGWAYKVGNTDDIANLVEFGAHAGGDPTAPVLGYRVFGKTMDIMEGRR